MSNLSGATTAVFIVRLSAALEVPVNVAWKTKDGTAKAGTDYEAASGTVTFEPGETTRQIQVSVYGREAGDTETRTFSIELYPPENAILDQTLTEVKIEVTDESGVAVTSLVVATGPRGIKGDPGLSSYELAKLQGFDGTLQEYIEQETAAGNAADRAGNEADRAGQEADRAGQEADRAEAAAGDAQTIADANTYYTSVADPDGTIGGLAGTDEGAGFRVAIQAQAGVTVAFVYYRKVAGAAKFITAIASNTFVNLVKQMIDATNARTDGLKTLKLVDDVLFFLAKNGPVVSVDNTGLVRAIELIVQKLKADDFEVLNFLAAIIQAQQLKIGGSTLSSGPFPLSVNANNGRVLVLDETGRLLGIELDFEQIKLGGVDILDIISGLTPAEIKRFKMKFIAGYIHFAFYGQSQVIGTSNGTIHSTSFIDNELMLNGGLKSWGTPGYNTSIPQENYYTSLRAIYEVNGETYCSGMAITARAYINAQYPGRDIRNIYTVNGAGGSTVEMLKKGTAPYNRMIAQHVALINLLASMGEAYHFPALGWSQGGSDDGLATDPDVWEAAVDKLRTDYNADIFAQTGVKVDPVWIINQINNYMRYPALGGKPNIGLRQYKMVTNGEGKYFGASPTYICDFIDVAHWTKESQVKVGAYFEKTRRFILEEGYWEPLHPIRITTTGKFSTAQFHLPQNRPLQFNTEFVAEATNYGFSAAQADGTPIGIDRVRLVSDDTVEVRYTDLPLPGAVLMYGQTGQIGDPNAADGSGLGRTHGMRGNLCDTAGDDEKIYVSASEPEYPLHNWCWMFTEDMGV